MKKTSKLIIQIGIILGFLGTIIVNTLSSLGIINNKDPGSLSDALPNLFVPSGITFAIWGVIYIALLGLTIYSIRSWFKKEMDPPEFLEKMGIEFIIASIANISWIFLWHYQAELNSTAYSLIFMLILLGALISAYIRLKIGKNKEASKGEKWFIHIPFGIYLGWITIATVANITALLVETGWENVIAPTDTWKIIWTIIVISVAAIIALLILIIRKDIAYSLIVVWALIGIILKRIEVANLGDPLVIGVIIASGVSIGLITILIGITIYRLIMNKKENA